MVTHREEVCFDARRHGAVLARPLTQAVVLALIGGILLAEPWPLPLPGAALIVVAAAVCLRAVWRWERTHLVVTTDKLCLVDGTLRRRSATVRLRAVENLELEQTLTGRLLGDGTLGAATREVHHVPQRRAPRAGRHRPGARAAAGLSARRAARRLMADAAPVEGRELTKRYGSTT